jgi:hypothetical protein
LQGADVENDVTLQLITKEVDNGWVKIFPGTLQEAEQKWGADKTAVGKINVVRVPGEDDRMVMDSTVPGLTDRVRQAEKPRNPNPESINDAVGRDTSGEEWIGFSADVKGAHKCCRLREDEHGLMLFTFLGVLCYYCVCHFGGTWSSYWWSRVAAALHRMLHRLLWHPHQGWIYVDDWLWRLRRETAAEEATLITLFLMALGCPMSFHKLDFGPEILWIGCWANFQMSAWRLPEEKYEKLKGILRFFMDAGKTLVRTEVEA